MSDERPKKLPTWLLVLLIILGVVAALVVLGVVLLVVGLGLLAYACSTH